MNILVTAVWPASRFVNVWWMKRKRSERRIHTLKRVSALPTAWLCHPRNWKINGLSGYRTVFLLFFIVHRILYVVFYLFALHVICLQKRYWKLSRIITMSTTAGVIKLSQSRIKLWGFHNNVDVLKYRLYCPTRLAQLVSSFQFIIYEYFYVPLKYHRTFANKWNIDGMIK